MINFSVAQPGILIRITTKRSLLALSFIFLASISQLVLSEESCQKQTVSLQVLGSGGPFGASKRASTSYLIWLNQKSRFMVDIGGGSFLRFNEAGGLASDLEWIGLSHYHPDHTSDLPAFFWSSRVHKRDQPLQFSGPAGNDTTPSLTSFLDSLMHAETGAFPGLNQLKNSLVLKSVDTQLTKPTEVYHKGNVQITALGVPHGNIPTVAYRIDVGSSSIVLASDQLGTNKQFIKFAKGADILIMHLVISEGASKPATLFHAKPTVIGKIAKEINPKTLVLSHISKLGNAHPLANYFSDENLAGSIADVKSIYKGDLILAKDLLVLPSLCE